MTLDLGGPGAGCSAMRLRRLLAGELSSPEKERMLAHVAQCARCAATQAELLQEKAALARDVPFPAFAAGVAERIAVRPARRRALRWAPFAAAAAVLLGAGALVLRPADTQTVRSKGAATAQVFVQDAAGVHPLQGPVAQGARLMVTLRSAGRRYAAAVLLEPAEASVLYSGTAVNGPLPQALEWIGSGAATLLVVFSDQPLDATRLHTAADAPAGAEVVQVPLRR